MGAGRKPLDASQRWLGGNASHSAASVGAPETVKPSERQPVEPPSTLSALELAAWLVNAPLAVEAGTLTEASADSFRVLCELEVEAASVLAERRTEGWTTRGMFLAKEYRGLVQRLESKRRAFMLEPMGKPIVAPAAPPADPFAEFDGPRLVKGAGA